MKKDVLSTDTLTAAMGELALRYVPRVFPCIDSTNAEAKRLAVAGERYALIAAEEQTAGRGRMGRGFHSPDGAGVYFSVLHTFRAAAADAVSITSAAAVAVMRAILRVCGKQTAIKWVNDLYLDGKKAVGILAESVLDPAEPTLCSVIVGIGINLRPISFPPELAEIATSLNDATTARSALIAAVMEELTPFLDDPADRSWLADYRAHSCVIGREIVWIRGGERFSGRAEDIDADGALLVRLSDGSSRRLATGEISVRI
ncbi:MAG: biotin--[Clostridia bacterium]|nr:biotin--[acetyl-CoA-carboxylase] ligase [Clostridia bacterium]